MSGGLQEHAADDFRRTAESAASRVIGRYSSSFGLATRLLREPVRTRVRSIYALVRIADEIVDGAAAGSGEDGAQIAAALDDYERRTEEALDSGFSTDLVIHAFARAARASGITAELTRPFFASMRADLEVSAHTAESFARYVDGSAEVVGLMCLHVFATDDAAAPVPPDPELIAGARSLGAAFQKVNFLRDLREDSEIRGRSYFPGLEPAGPTEEQKLALLADIDEDLARAQASIERLPASSRAAVQAAHDLFAALSRRLRRTPAARLREHRVRVPTVQKAAIAARAVAGGRGRARSRVAGGADGAHRPVAQPRRVVIIGGGVAGLATAALLATEGHQVTVLERGEEVGGRAGTWREGGFTFDTGPSWWLMHECFEHFFALLGERIEDHLDLVDLDPAYRVLGEEYAHPLDLFGDRERSAAAFEAEESGAGDALRAHLDSARGAYEMATSSFLYTTFSAVPVRTLLRLTPRAGSLARLLGESLHDLAARTVADTRLRQVLGYPAVFLGATPRTAPSLYHLMSAMDLEDGVRYPRGGFTRFIEVLRGLAEDAGAEIRTGVEVTRIRTTEQGRARVAGVEARPADGSGGTEAIGADVVVSAADLHHTETSLLPRALQTYPERIWRSRTSGPGAVLAMLGVRGRVPELLHHTLLFTDDWDRNFAQITTSSAEWATRAPDPASIYVCMPSRTDPSVAPAGDENLFVLIPVAPETADGRGIGRGGIDGAGDGEVERAVDRAIAQIADWAHVPDLAERVVVRRTVGPGDFTDAFHSWRGSALGPAHTLRQSAFLRGSNRSRKVEGLLYAGGTTVPGIGVPMCLISAENVLKRLRGDTSSTPLPEPLREP
jgi:phytoene desaturase